jgi:hypothetical protein
MPEAVNHDQTISKLYRLYALTVRHLAERRQQKPATVVVDRFHH